MTSTVTSVISNYPNGVHLQSLSKPSFLISYSATRISSGCSCLSLTPPTTTITATGSTVVSNPLHSHFHLTSYPIHTLSTKSNPIQKTVYTTQTSTTTLSGPCATNTPYLNAIALNPAPDNMAADATTEFSFLNNAFDCCNECQNGGMYFPNCVAYVAFQGTCTLVFNRGMVTGPACGNGDATVVEKASEPDGLGGTGPCGTHITVSSS